MAVATYGNIRLDTGLTGNLPTSTWKVSVGGLQQRLEPAIYIERSLTGNMQIHRVQESGAPMVFDGMRYAVFLTETEKNSLATYLGKTVYFMPHVRDEDAGWADYRSIMLFKSMAEVEPYDPMLEWWKAVIELESADGRTV